MQEITIADKTFERFISEKQIAQRVAELGQLISEDYKDKNPLFLVLLKGAYVFASDLVKHFLHPCSISFFRLSSYKGMASSGVLSFKDVFDEDIAALVDDGLMRNNNVIRLVSLNVEAGTKGQKAKIGLKSEELKGQLCCAIENVYDDQQSIFHFSS